MPRNSDRQRHRRGATIAIGSVAVIIAVVAALAGIGYAKYLQFQAAMAAPPPPEMPVAVTLSTAQPITFRRSTVVVGSVLAPQSIQLRTELNGIVTDVPMVPGQQVNKGDLLVQFDVRTERAELKSAEANLKLANASLQRSKRLANVNATSDQEHDIAAAEVTRSEAEVDRLKIMIEKKSLVAPFDANVGLFDLHVGQYLEQGTAIAMLDGIDNYLNIDFAVPAHVADAIELGDQILVQANTLSPELKAEIVAIDSQADSVSRSVTVRARLNNPPATLQPNDSVRVTVEFGGPINAVSIPSTAVRRGPTGTSAYLATTKDGQLRAQARSIVLAGGGDGVNSWVAMGIEAGQSVVADGSFKVSEGALLIDVSATQSAVANQATSSTDAAQRSQTESEVEKMQLEASVSDDTESKQ